MSPIKYITIKEAADMSGKSIQTVRRMIKSKKIRYRKDKTPQGFNYLIELDSAIQVFRLTQNDLRMLGTIDQEATPASVSKTVIAEDHDYAEVSESFADEIAAETTTLTTLDRSHQQIVSYEPIKEFNDTMQKLIDQHGKEKENLFKLIENFQNKVISLESKLKVETATKKSWFNIW